MTRKRKLALKGVSLTEILIVIAILIVLALLGFTFFRSQTIKAVDAKKKSDVRTIQIAAEQYERDKDCYPTSGIVSCNPGDGLNPYLYKIPCDPKGNSYYYETENKSCPSWYRIFATLENTADSSLVPNIGELGAYNYYVGSPNAPIPTPVAVAQGSGTPTPTPGGGGSGGSGSGGGGAGTPTPTPSGTPSGEATPTPSSTPGTTTIFSNSTDDATIDSQNKNSKYGTNFYLETARRQGSSFSDINTLLKFTVSGIGSKRVTSARIRIYDVTYPTYANNRNEEVYLGSTNNWSESNVTWNNAPQIQGSAIVTTNESIINQQLWREFDVTQAVQVDGTYTFRVRTGLLYPSANYLYASRQYGITYGAQYYPQLIVDVTN